MIDLSGLAQTASRLLSSARVIALEFLARASRHGAASGRGALERLAAAARGGLAGLAALTHGLWQRRPRRLEPGHVLTLAVGVFAALLTFELHTSALQSQLMSMVASRLTWQVGPGPSERLVVPRDGPFDITRGYTRIPDFRKRLERRGYRVTSQSRFSQPLVIATRAGVTPPARERAVTGLVIRGRNGDVLYDATARKHRFEAYDDIPPLVAASLLLMEDRQLQRAADERRNAAVDWGRFSRAMAFSAGSRLGLPVSFQGGSTLAIQMEKYRHSENGRTGSVTDKLRQMVTASLRLYRDGPDTREEQRLIVLDYLNSVPLGGAPGYGEVLGVGEGLRAWFGLEPNEVFDALRAGSAANPEAHARALKHVLALLCAVRAPTRMLSQDHADLERRVALYQQRLVEHGLLDSTMVSRLSQTALRFGRGKPDPAVAFEQRKAVDAVRRQLLSLLGLKDYYELDGLDLEVETSFDPKPQRQAVRFFRQLEDPEFVAAAGLDLPRLLETGDPSQVAYSLLVFEREGDQDVLRVRADNLDQPFDLNTGMRMELGSTAKLRTLAHYLDLVERLYHEMEKLSPEALEERATQSPDAISRWAAVERLRQPEAPLDTLLEHAMERRFRASPHEAFFTGGGLHTFRNFDPEAEDGKIFSVREAFTRSNNLVFVRLMRDLVRYHEARLPYDASTVLTDLDSPVRQRMVLEEGDAEARLVLRRAYQRLRGASAYDMPIRLLGLDATVRDMAIFYFASQLGPGDSLRSWLASQGAVIDPEDAGKLARAFSGDLKLLDFSYLLDRHPLEVWCAVELSRDPLAGWDRVLARSAGARQEAQSWLMQPKNRRAQDLRLRARIERDAFVRMTADWKRLGFPFEHLVPSLATALGSSADRPEALADLMGIIVNDGVERPKRFIRKLRFGAGGPYETELEPLRQEGERRLSQPVAHMLRGALAGVVEHGTARRILGAYLGKDGEPLAVGGKTGSGDNRVDAVAENGQRIRSRTVSRTAAFVFYVGDRWYGVVTASVPGRDASDYGFTSALPLEVLKRLAPPVEPTSARVPAGDQPLQ